MKLNVCNIAKLVLDKYQMKIFGLGDSSEIDEQIKTIYILNCDTKVNNCVVNEPCISQTTIDCDITLSNLGLVTTVVDELTFSVTVTGGNGNYIYNWIYDSNNLELVSQNGNEIILRVKDPTTSLPDEPISVNVEDTSGCSSTQNTTFNYTGIPDCFICLYPDNRPENKCIYPDNDANAEFLNS